MVIFLQYVTIHNIYTIILFRVDQERKDTKRRDGQHMSPAGQSHPHWPPGPRGWPVLPEPLSHCAVEITVLADLGALESAPAWR